MRVAIDSGSPRSLRPSPFTPAVKKDMAWYYKNRLVESAPGKRVVARIHELTKGKCAFCHIAKATTLDHSYPKAMFPRLAVEPMNLVPACRDCNLGRNIGHGTVSISPYFDHWVESFAWLEACVVDPARPEDLTFFVLRDAHLDDDQWNALECFFRESALGARYTDQAIDTFSVLVRELKLSLGMPTVEDVKAVLAERLIARQQALGPNRWETAAFKAWLAASTDIDWCAAGMPS